MSLSEEERQRIEEEERVRAEAKLRAEAEAKQKLEREQAAKAAEEKKKAEDKVKKGCLGCLGVIVLLIVIGSLLPDSKNGSGRDPGDESEPQVMARMLIRAWEVGESGDKYWKDGVALQSLYAVRDYDHITGGGWKKKDGSWELGRAWHRFRIKSSTRGGFPVENLWDIELEKVGSEWKVVRVTAAQE
jgi:hypothetical protein